MSGDLNLFPEESKSEEKPPKPHYSGHRQRLRERFVQGGAEAFQDYELLELILFMAIPRRDVKPLAKELLAKYKTLPALLAAPIQQLTQTAGVSENVAISLKAVAATAHRMLRQEVMNKPVLNNWTRLMDYCMATMAHEGKEHFRILFLNKKNELIADEIQGSGTVDQTPAYPREVVKRALELSATALILLHNHPSGDPSPSQADIDLTRDIIRAAEPLNITIHDHVIVSHNGYVSMKGEGWL